MVRSRSDNVLHTLQSWVNQYMYVHMFIYTCNIPICGIQQMIQIVRVSECFYSLNHMSSIGTTLRWSATKSGDFVFFFFFSLL